MQMVGSMKLYATIFAVEIMEGYGFSARYPEIPHLVNQL